MIRVAIVDDHPIALRGMEQILTEADSVRVVLSVASVGDLPQFMLSAEGGTEEADGYDVLVLDLYHQGETPCLDAVAQFSATTKVLIISASGGPADVLGAIRAGAVGYVTKQSSMDTLVTAVRTVAVGGLFLSAHLADILQAELTRLGPGDQVPLETGLALSPREEQALGLIASGFTYSQTATRMGVSKATVDTYVERIRGKLHVNNKAGLIRAAFTYGVVAPTA